MTEIQTAATKKRIGIMLDIESLDLGSRCVITQLAAVVFDLDDPDTIIREVEEYLPIQPQIDTFKRTISADTIIWWMQQEEAARLRFKQNEGTDFEELSALVNSVNRKLAQEISEADEVEVWARGPQFDIVNIESLFGDLALSAPWKYDSVRDLRTLMSLAGVGKKEMQPRAGLIPHVALHDCKFQIDIYVESMRRLRAKV